MIKHKVEYERDKIKEIGDRIERYADRFENANKNKEAQNARNLSKKIRSSIDLYTALKIEKNFY